jgi:3-dehydroquinate synthase
MSQGEGMPVIYQQVPVQFSYPVHFTEALFAPENPLLADLLGRDGPHKLLAVVDEGVLRHHRELPAALQSYAAAHPQALQLAAPILPVPGGEAVKNDPQWVARIHEAVDAAGICRHSYLAAIGGGAVLDMAGFAAATAHRGVRLIRVPTTVLAQNDSGVGVKNGINAFGKKNFLGTFAPPHAVLNDSHFLTTLDARDWRAGIAEAVKVALIKDAEFFRFIEAHAGALARRAMPPMQQLIQRCAALHLDHIANRGDPFEKGSSRPLDFGHWAAHKLEQLSDYRLRHGEAVAIGIALDSTYSYLAAMLPETPWKRILAALEAVGFDLYVPELEEELTDASHPRSVFRGLGEFREHLGGELTLTLLTDIGHGIEVHQVDQALYRQAVGLLARRQGQTLKRATA